MEGSLCLVLHAHLPFVRHPEHERFLEEDWLYEAISESYLPLLLAFDRLTDEGIPFRLTWVLTPTLTAMLRDPLLMDRYRRKLEDLCELAEREVRRTRNLPDFEPLARFYRDRFSTLREAFDERYRGDLLAAFSRLEREGRLELVTCAATHAFLPLMRDLPEAVHAQVAVGMASHREAFGRSPNGIWLPECGWFPGLETELAESALRFFFVDTHALADATPRPVHGVWAKIFTPAGVAAFGRDPESSEQVWSSKTGYPGDPLYREFYRDIGWDLPLEDVGPWVQPDGSRKNTGIKYHRITGPTDRKALWRPGAARARAELHAGHFLDSRRAQMRDLEARMRPAVPLVVAPYDAELFGHWWFEGPWFIESLLRRCAAQTGVRLVTPTDELQRAPDAQVAEPAAGSWGEKGHAGMWLDEANDWIYPHLHHATRKMIALANDYPEATGLLRRALNQTARELMLARASDWAFIMRTGTMVDYAVKRTREHLLRVLRLDEQVRAGAIDEAWLSHLENKDNLFPFLDYRVYRTRS